MTKGPSRRIRVGSIVWLLCGSAAGIGCAARGPEVVGPPPIPLRTGPLQVDVVYPPQGSRIAARDSNFIFGSIGNGNARLTINGATVPVEPNGAFLAWLPVPAVTQDTLVTYHLIASHSGATVSVDHSVRMFRTAAPSADGPTAIDSTRISPRGVWWVREGEAVPIRIAATPGARVRLVTPGGESVPLTELPLTEDELKGSGNPSSRLGGWARGSGLYVGQLVARQPLGAGARSRRPPAIRPPAPLQAAACGDGRFERCAYFEIVRAGDTVRARLALDLWILEGPGPVVELREAPAVFGSDGVVAGRSAPGATIAWLWANGVRARVTGRRNEAVRIALDSQTDAWVGLSDVAWVAGTKLESRVRVGAVRLNRRPGRLEVRVILAEPVPYSVRIKDRRATLVLYGAYSDTDRIRHGPEDDFFRQAEWEQLTRDRYVLRLDFARKPWGYRARYESGALVLDVRAPPAIDPERPLEGRRIVVDPGHPPAGATGPTRLYEGDANLAIAVRLKRLLEREGARVTLTRTDRATVRLYDRPQRAELLQAEVLVSIHNNALPDGVNPFENHGTSVYYFHPGEVDLARELQRGLLRTLGLRDLGIFRASLALARPTWMPSALTEGAFMMIPEHEAALRTPQFQEAYARGVVDGLRAFLKRRVD